MITVRRARERGQTRLDWLDSQHTFSFGDYHDPRHMGFGALRVINEDVVVPGAGFATHAHRDMEILTWVLDGALAHRDSLGTGATINPGEMQRMSAGTGIRHSEYNASAEEPVHFLQIWVLPDRAGLAPEYEQKAFTEDDLTGSLRLLASKDGRESSITVHQDVDLYAACLRPGDALKHTLTDGRRAWLQVSRGSVRLGDQALAAGDGAGVTGEPEITLTAADPAEVLLFDLA